MKSSATPAPHAARSLVVNLDRAGRPGKDSVNEARGQARSRYRHLRLCHTTRAESGPYGRSRGLVTACPFTDVETTPTDWARRSALVRRAHVHDPRTVPFELDELDRDPLQPQQPIRADVDVLNLNLKLRTLGHARDLTS